MTLFIPSLIKIYKLVQNVLRCMKIQARARTHTHTHGHGTINPLNAELNPICHLRALLGVHSLHVSRI